MFWVIFFLRNSKLEYNFKKIWIKTWTVCFSNQVCIFCLQMTLELRPHKNNKTKEISKFSFSSLFSKLKQQKSDSWKLNTQNIENKRVFASLNIWKRFWKLCTRNPKTLFISILMCKLFLPLIFVSVNGQLDTWIH